MEPRVLRSFLISLLVIAYCASTLAIDTNERGSKSLKSNDRQESSSHQAERIRLPRRLSSRHNELGITSTEPAKHRLLNSDDSGAERETDSTSDSRTLDDGLLLSSAGNGKERKSSTKPVNSSDDDDKKTLSQQVKEGKYGLIQNEIYPEKPKRPGIISYSANSEVPSDNASNLGGLDEKEIWLAENHVLVLKGGNFPDSEAPITDQQLEDNWPPIDDYNAPRRQVKIPPRPKVPPPFPVQLIEGGPIQLIGTNSTSLAENGTIDFESLPGGFKGFLPGEGPYFPLPSAPTTTGNTSDGLPEKKNKADGPPGPFYPALPPGAVIVPPPSNQTDYDDEDQSIYYPPPYSFVYPQDNSTAIPPGPLVPGIILPPPPDFFSSLDNKKPVTKEKSHFQKRPILSTTPVPSRPPYLPPVRSKSSTKIYKTPSVTSSTTVGSKIVSYNPKPFGRSKLKNATTYRTEKTTPRLSYHAFVEPTSEAPIESTTLESPPQDKYQHFEPIIANQLPIEETSTEKPWRSVISSRPVSLLTFYASTTPSSVDEPVETTPASIQNVLTTENPAVRYPSQASYYFYEETNSPRSDSDRSEETPSSTVDPVVYFSTTTETTPTYYKLEQQTQPESEKKDYYDVEMIPSQRTSKDYSVKLIDSIVKNPQIYRYLDSGATSSHDKYEAQPVRSQSPRTLHSEPLYYQSASTRAPPKLSYFSTTARPKSYYRQSDAEYSKPTPKPIYQYSFEATGYSKRGNHALSPKTKIVVEEPQPIAVAQPLQQQPPRRQKELPLYQEYQDIQSVSDQYDYEGSEAVADQKLQTEKTPYLSSKTKERSYYHQPQSTTVLPIRDTTLASHQQYFTKQDEQLLDDVTKEYFTMFGKKLASGKLPSTTPIYGKSSVTERPKYTNVNSYNNAQPDYGSSSRQYRPPNIKVHYGDQTPGPYSLKDDVLVNYKNPLPSINPDSEFIPVVNPSPRPPTIKYRPRPVLQVSSKLRDFSLQPLVSNVRQRLDHLRGYGTQRSDQQQQQVPQRNSFIPLSDPRETIRGYHQPQRPVSLEGDVAVNYKNPRPPINPDAEFIPTKTAGNTDNKANSYFAYRLPGDGGHFYFLTPQAISREDTGGYLFSRPRGSRLLRRRRGRDGD